MESTITDSSIFFESFTQPDRNRTLWLPRAWSGRRLPPVAFLRNRYGDIWLVTVAVDEETKIYSFEDGWKTFVTFNKVEFKDHFVFKFDGTLTFDFKIFDKNNEEKEYVRLPSIKREVEIKQKESVSESEPEEKAQHQVRDGDTRPKKRAKTRGPAVKLANEEAVLRKAGIVRPKNPYFLTKRIERNEMHIPRKLTKDFMLNYPEEVIIQDEKGRGWKTPVIKCKNGRVWISGGWKSYCRWNNVNVDDWCVIEILKPEAPGADLYLKARLIPASALIAVESSQEPHSSA